MLFSANTVLLWATAGLSILSSVAAAPYPDNADIVPREAELSTSNKYQSVNIARDTHIFKRTITSCVKTLQSCEKAAKKKHKGEAAKTAALDKCGEEHDSCVTTYLTKCTAKALKKNCKECAICLEEFQLAMPTAIKGANCLDGHYFDYECLKIWASRAESENKCPMCKNFIKF